MKQTIKNLALLLVLSITTQVSFAQNTSTTLLSYNDGKSNTEKIIKSTNVQDVASEIGQYIAKKIDFDSPKFEYFNQDVKVMASFTVDKEGNVKKVSIRENHPAYAHFGKEVKTYLESITDVTPIVENGKVVQKIINMPIIYKPVR